MRVDLFDYDLPKELIAQHPLPQRDLSRLMVLNRADESIEHSRFYMIGEYLRPGDILVINDTKVIPARLFGKKARTGGRVEMLLLREIKPRIWEVLIKPVRKLYPGVILEFGSGELKAKFLGRSPSGVFTVSLRYDGELREILDRIGKPPLPPYIKREPDEKDRERYQCVYAEKNGSVAAPTAGLHFTEELLGKLEERGIGITRITLHVGLGTFQPVKAEIVEKHKMHSEFFQVPPEAAEAIMNARSRGGRVIAVGTTSVRTLETVADEEGNIAPSSGYTDLFIYPGYRFKVVDGMVTNFHLPRSTLLMLVCAFAGREFTLRAYREAVKKGYRFYSYGDAMLIL
jgi:S-adenosylmethionine:tRNA ribosyltransferase-isomerase